MNVAEAPKLQPELKVVAKPAQAEDAARFWALYQASQVAILNTMGYSDEAAMSLFSTDMPDFDLKYAKNWQEQITAQNSSRLLVGVWLESRDEAPAGMAELTKDDRRMGKVHVASWARDHGEIVLKGLLEEGQDFHGEQSFEVVVPKSDRVIRAGLETLGFLPVARTSSYEIGGMVVPQFVMTSARR